MGQSGHIYTPPPPLVWGSLSVCYEDAQQGQASRSLPPVSIPPTANLIAFALLLHTRGSPVGCCRHRTQSAGHSSGSGGVGHRVALSLSLPTHMARHSWIGVQMITRLTLGWRISIVADAVVVGVRHHLSAGRHCEISHGNFSSARQASGHGTGWWSVPLLVRYVPSRPAVIFHSISWLTAIKASMLTWLPLVLSGGFMRICHDVITS